MRHFILSISVCSILIANSAFAQAPAGRSVEKLDPALDAIISADSKIEVAKTGFEFVEGINWVPQGKSGYLLFSDLSENAVKKMTPDGNVTVYLAQSGYHGAINSQMMLTVGGEIVNGDHRRISIGSDGLTLDNQGRLIICTYSGRTVERLEKNGKRTVLADNYEGKRFNGPNDVVVKKDGAIYFTDSILGLRNREKSTVMGLDFEGIFMIKNGKVTLVVKDIPLTNGLAFSPDEKYLYANVRFTQHIRRYDVQPDDTMTNSRLLVDMSADKRPGNADGMRVDSAGNIFSTGPGGIWIVSPEGKHLGTILMPQNATNMTFGDPDLKTLYITAQSSIYKIRVNTPGQHR